MTLMSAACVRFPFRSPARHLMWYARGGTPQLWGLLLLLPVVSAFLPPPSRLVGTRARLGGGRSHAFATRTVRGRGALSCTLTSDDKTVINGEFNELLASKDILKTIDVLRKHRSLLDLDWSKATSLLNKISNTDAFRDQVAERMVEKSELPDLERMLSNPANPVMAFEKYQKEQLEATSLVYEVLKEKKLLRAFSCVADVKAYSEAFLPKPVTPTDIESRANLPMTALAPGKGGNLWLYAGGLICVAELLICAYVGVDAGGVIPGTIAAFFLDRFFFGGRVFDQIARVVIPKYKERIIRHEAGHFLLAYLLGCPIQACLLRPVWNGAIFGEAGTIFLDKKLFEEMDRNRISASSVDRYSTVVMGGIAAEALSFENAEGGGSDEQSIIMLLSLMNPPWDFERITSQARWGALRALLVLKEYRSAYEALVEALMRGDGLGPCIKAIEDALAVREELVPAAAIIEPPAPKAPAQIDDFRRVLLPTDGLGGASAASSSASLPNLPSDVPKEVKDAMEAFRRAAEADVKPSFEVGGDAIRLQEDKEKEEMATKERALEVRLRELEGQLKRVNSQIEGKPVDTSEPIPSFSSPTKPSTTEAVSSPGVSDDSAIDEQLKSLDERLKRLKAMLGE